MAELRVTETNSGRDHKGTAFNLPGNAFLIPLYGFIASALLCASFIFVFRFSYLISASIGVLPLILSVLYVVLFIYKRPPAFTSDVWILATRGRALIRANRFQPVHPFKPNYL